MIGNRDSSMYSYQSHTLQTQQMCLHCRKKKGRRKHNYYLLYNGLTAFIATPRGAFSIPMIVCETWAHILAFVLRVCLLVLFAHADFYMRFDCQTVRGVVSTVHKAFYTTFKCVNTESTCLKKEDTCMSKHFNCRM